MHVPVNFVACINAPNSKECEETRNFFRDLLLEMYRTRFLPKIVLPIPRPDPPPFHSDPQPQPMQTQLAQTALIGELMSASIGSSKLPPILKEIRKSGLMLEAARQVLSEVETAAKGLKQEIEQLKK